MKVSLYGTNVFFPLFSYSVKWELDLRTNGLSTYVVSLHFEQQLMEAFLILLKIVKLLFKFSDCQIPTFFKIKEKFPLSSFLKPFL